MSSTGLDIMRFPSRCLIALGVALYLVTATPAVCARDLDDAQRFVAALYLAYQTDNPPNYVGRDAGKYFAPALLTLLRKDQDQAKGDAGELGLDPICVCQDYEISQIRVSVKPRGAGRAQATVQLVNAGEPQKLVLDLVTVAGQWRIADVHEKSMPSLYAFLARAARKRAH